MKMNRAAKTAVCASIDCTPAEGEVIAARLKAAATQFGGTCVKVPSKGGNLQRYFGAFSSEAQARGFLPHVAATSVDVKSDVGVYCEQTTPQGRKSAFDTHSLFHSRVAANTSVRRGP